MSAVDEYRKWNLHDFLREQADRDREWVPRELADAAIAELEAELANMRSERVMTKKQLHLTAHKLDKAEAELAAVKAKLSWIEGQPTCRVGDVLADWAARQAP